MRQHNQLFAILLVAMYAAMSTFGLAFVTCVEADGGQNLEALGASCCVSNGPLSAAATGQSATLQSGDSGREDCGDCQAHLSAVDIASRTIDETEVVLLAPTVLPASALPGAAVSSTDWLTSSTHSVRAPPPRSSSTIACLRSVILRC